MTNKSWDERRVILRKLLRELRKQNDDMTQEQLGELLGKPQSFVSKYESGERKLDYIELIEICQVFKLNIVEFDALYQKKLKKKSL
ncbi:helix-turn-helix domain-containing protein [Thalassomonas actiniarum]|uniref:Helix-turn-helix transcriptional regulator n=1 Tax=Thalassomonas actiniarum TaxID=485447 RepID=A0AAF0C406_9GAMM|nr:helix-turn-helix transcriptional regulator [Thalassomonas actiniarum]WDD99428.1 helix-turn-helix transcriptional regulator [Thalassomonas actiniarum]